MTSQVMSPQRGGVRIPRSAHAVSEQWRKLYLGASPAGEYLDPAVVDTAALMDQPEVVRRWLGRALAVGTPLGGAVQLQMHGQIRIGGEWRPFDADQVLAPPTGFIWAAATHMGGLPVTGFDRYTDHTGEMRWKLMGLVPVITATGPDITRSAAGRLAVEIVLAPTCFAAARWQATEDPNVARGSFMFPHGVEQMELRVAADGQLRSVSMMRWGDPDGNGTFARHPFGVELSHSETFPDGLTVPTTLRGGWGWGTDHWEAGEFFRARVTDAVLLRGRGSVA